MFALTVFKSLHIIYLFLGVMCATNSTQQNTLGGGGGVIDYKNPEAEKLVLTCVQGRLL